jgi:hypothetical protein
MSKKKATKVATAVQKETSPEAITEETNTAAELASTVAPEAQVAAATPEAVATDDASEPPSDDDKEEQPAAAEQPVKRLFVSSGAMLFVARTYRQLIGKEMDEALLAKTKDKLERGEQVNINNRVKDIDVSAKLRANHGYGQIYKK